MKIYGSISAETMAQHEWVTHEDHLTEMDGLRLIPITPAEVSVALQYLHPNKDDWTLFERSNMERALYKFWAARIAGKDGSTCPLIGR